MHLQPYLDRIAYRSASRPELDVLIALQRHHVCSVPFENLDVQLGRPVTIAAEDAYEKIVVNGRGGWCYEQNGLFAWALSEIGFEVTRMAASVMRQERDGVMDANHLCLLVEIPDSDKQYLVDVGFGGSMIQPIELLDAEYSQAPFRIGLRKLPDASWQYWERIGGGNEFNFDFLVEPASEAALAAKCDFLQSDPSSSFVQNLVAQLRQPKQHKTLRGRVLSIATADGIESSIIDSADELVATLAKHFYLEVPEVAELWPKVVARHEELQRQKALTDTYEIRARSNTPPT